MKTLVKLIRIYTPFICTVVALLNGVLFLGGVANLPAIYLMATLTGNSVLVNLYIFVTSLRMCIWYKLNVLCLLMIQICGLLYSYCKIPQTSYIWAVILFAVAGILFFLIFKVFYKVTRLFGCTRRR